MIALHDTMGNGVINLARIRTIDQARTNPHGARCQMVRFEDGETVNLLAGEVETILQRPVQLVPAEAGTALINAYRDEESGQPTIFKTPLTAWALCVDGWVRPVTAAGVNDDQGEPVNGFAILLPSGQVNVGVIANYASVEEYLRAWAGQEHD